MGVREGTVFLLLWLGTDCSDSYKHTHTSFIIMSNKGRLPALGLGKKATNTLWTKNIENVMNWISLPDWSALVRS